MTSRRGCHVHTISGIRDVRAPPLAAFAPETSASAAAAARLATARDGPSQRVSFNTSPPVVRVQNYGGGDSGVGGGSCIEGTVKFEQDAGTAYDVTVTYSIKNLPNDGPKGLHVHQYGDTRNTTHLTTMAAHFVPWRICETHKTPRARTTRSTACPQPQASARRHGQHRGDRRRCGGHAHLGPGQVASPTRCAPSSHVWSSYTKQDLGGTTPALTLSNRNPGRERDLGTTPQP